jgi:hypothetical protein
MDVHLLASALDEKEWKDFIARADAIRLRPVCVLSIRRAAACLGTPLPAAVRGWLAEPVDQQLDAVFRGAQVSPLGVLASDWRAAGSWRGRASLLRDHLLPDPGYIRARYTLARHLPLLPLCYLHRAVVGLARWSRGYVASLPARTFPPAPPRRRARPERV